MALGEDLRQRIAVVAHETQRGPAGWRRQERGHLRSGGTKPRIAERLSHALAGEPGHDGDDRRHQREERRTRGRLDDVRRTTLLRAFDVARDGLQIRKRLALRLTVRALIVAVLSSIEQHLDNDLNNRMLTIDLMPHHRALNLGIFFRCKRRPIGQ
jgi:hypothetical protein